MPESTPKCTVRFHFRDGLEQGISGHATFAAAGLKDRNLEFRGKPTGHEVSMFVPADKIITVSADFDGYEAVESSFRAGPPDSIIDKAIDLLPTVDSSALTFLLPPLSDGRKYPDGVLFYVLLQGASGSDIGMPMRSVPSQSSRLSIGRVPAGQLYVRAYTSG